MSTSFVKKTPDHNYEANPSAIRKSDIARAMALVEVKRMGFAPTAQALAHGLIKNKDHEFRPLEMTHLDRQMPERTRIANRLVAQGYDHLKDLGRHTHHPTMGVGGDLDDFAKKAGVSREVLDRMGEVARMDYVTQALINRKSDADLPIPEPTLRDHIDAAFKAHEE